MHRKFILLAESNETVKNVIKIALGTGYEFIEVSKHSEVLRHINNQIDMILMDHSLPDKNCFEILWKIRRIKPGLPVIVMTSYSDESLAIRAFRAGATDYLKKPLCLEYLRGRVSEILEGTVFEGSDESKYSTREDFILDGIAEYINANYMEELSLGKLAKMVGMDKFKFCRIFKKKFGQGFVSYLNEIRIKKAADMLSNPDLNVTEAAFAAGFGSIDHFNRIFKAKYGLSPRDYRRKYYPAPAGGNQENYHACAAPAVLTAKKGGKQ